MSEFEEWEAEHKPLFIKYQHQRIKWTQLEDEELMRQSFEVTQIRDISMPNRTNRAFVQRLFNLAKQGNKVNVRQMPWTREKDRELAELVNSGKSYSEIAIITGRSTKALTVRVHQ